MAQFTVYSSADASAPTLSGTAGDLVNVLDKCLVNGYGSKAAAGWTITYTGTNQRQYKMGAGAGMELYVNDNTPSVANEARVTAFEVGTGLGTGTGQFPYTGATGLDTSYNYFRKSSAASATTKPWMVFADSQTFYFCVQNGDLAANVWYVWGFGAFYSFVPNDPYNVILIAKASTENTGAGSLGDSVPSILTATSMGTTQAGHWIPRAYHGNGQAVKAACHRFSPGQALSTLGATPATPFAYPNGADSAVMCTPVRILENSQSYFRGRLRGIYDVPHATGNFSDGDTLTFQVGDDYAAKTIRCMKPIYASNLTTGAMWFETSNTLETN